MNHNLLIQEFNNSVWDPRICLQSNNWLRCAHYQSFTNEWQQLYRKKEKGINNIQYIHSE